MDFKLYNFQIDEFILSALREDISSEDITTNAIYRDEIKASVELISKDQGIIAGLDAFKRAFTIMDPDVEFEFRKKDSDSVENMELIGSIKGNVKTLLTSERVALNYLQRMSGIATYARRMVDKLGDDRIKIADTRKTIPNMRVFEKYAARVGGAVNHRYNLSDGVLIKDNHIAAAGSVKKAIKMAKEYAPFVKKIEVEVEDLNMLKEALDAGADIIMLDNMSIDLIKEALKIINKKALVECSGNIDLNNIENYRGLDIDIISSGSITHSAKNLDFSMKNLKY
ncbi:carboxylating nicotinate-nucleotide diphosphorylase [Peptoniphilus catoniae]|uniref:carboxylating nicotinate-nucleotide diphosphorylase n=1 Tax=Peptoniphilus catoniae TaxID=1660341 RepID=UPI0010FF562A|nr:carboxylating nicotinate-nucleotide diphosphorylase [Peptoniphilus catoniae]